MTKKEFDKEQREKLVTQLKVIFKGLGADLIDFKGLGADLIDELVVKARGQAIAEMFDERKNELAKLFDNELKTLQSRGCPQAILTIFQNNKSEVLERAVVMDIPDGNIPFVPVIPRSYMGIYALMPMVRNGEKVGYTSLAPYEIIDNEKCPKEPYYIYNVEPGKATFGKTPEEAEKIIKGQNRLCHVLEEDIAVCVHTDVLSYHWLLSVGSRYVTDDKVPLITNQLECFWDVIDNQRGDCGFASCHSRV